MRNLEMMAFIVALPMVLGCPSDGGDGYEITKTVLYHNLSKLGDCCFYSFRIAPDPDQQVNDADPFAQYIDVFYGSEAVGCADELGFGFVARSCRKSVPVWSDS